MVNQTIEKFGYPSTLVRDFDHWMLLVRPAQVTLGSVILAAKADALSYADLPGDAFREQGEVVKRLETGLKSFCRFERINYLMLMMVDPHVHFHVIPRYPGERQWQGLAFADAGWPGLPDLKSAVVLDGEQCSALAAAIRHNLG